MKNIAILVPSFPVASETFVVTEIKALQRAGHKVSVLTLEKSDDFRRTYQGIPVWHFSDAPACASFCNALFYGDVSSAWQSVKQQQAISNVSLMRVGCQLAHLLMLHGIEHLHCHFMHNSLAYGIVASKLAGITVSGIGHGHDIYVNRTDLAAKLSMCDFSVAVCEDMLTLFNALGAQQPKLLHCGVDVSRFLPSDKIAKPQKRLLVVSSRKKDCLRHLKRWRKFHMSKDLSLISLVLDLCLSLWKNSQTSWASKTVFASWDSKRQSKSPIWDVITMPLSHLFVRPKTVTETQALSF